MKTHDNAAIKAHLIRGAFYLLVLIAVCAIPFALAQSRGRGTTKLGVANAANNASVAMKFAAASSASGGAQATKLSGAHSKAASQSNASSRLLPYDVRGVPDLPSIFQFSHKTSGGLRAADDPGGPDQVYRTDGATGGGGTPTPTPTGSPTCIPVTPGPWITASPYPTAIARYGFAQIATHLYVFGGISDGTPVNAVNRLNLATGIWEPRAPMPFTSEALTCALMESTGIVYCAEGDLGNSFASYNIATDSWTLLANTPNADDYGSASGAFNGKVFLAGGTTGFSNAVWVYDVASDTWSAGTAAPNGYLLAGYQQVGQYLYVVGGWTGGGPNGLTTTTRLDMSSAPGLWENGPTFPLGRADFGLVYNPENNKLFVLGGDLCCDGNFFNSTNKVDELDLSVWPSGLWVHLYPNLPLPNRQANQGGFYGTGDIWSVGGIEGATLQSLPDVYHRTTSGGCASPTPTATATATATATPTGSPSCTPIVINGSIDDSDPTQTDKLDRSGIPQTCPATTMCAIFGDAAQHHYDSYTFMNTTGSTQCVTIDTSSACIGVRFIFIGAYLGSFDPNNICTNWIGDAGFSPNPDQAFQVEVPAGQTLVVVVSEVNHSGCPAYTLTITGLCQGGTPSPPPTATPTTSASATAITTATPTVTSTATPTVTSTATPTATATGSPTPRPTPTPRPAPTPRPRPTAAPRP